MNSCTDGRTLIELSLYDFCYTFFILFFRINSQLIAYCLDFLRIIALKDFIFDFKNREKCVYNFIFSNNWQRECLQRNLIIGVISNSKFSREREREQQIFANFQDHLSIVGTLVFIIIFIIHRFMCLLKHIQRHTSTQFRCDILNRIIQVLS